MICAGNVYRTSVCLQKSDFLQKFDSDKGALLSSEKYPLTNLITNDSIDDIAYGISIVVPGNHSFSDASFHLSNYSIIPVENTGGLNSSILSDESKYCNYESEAKWKHVYTSNQGGMTFFHFLFSPFKLDKENLWLIGTQVDLKIEYEEILSFEQEVNISTEWLDFLLESAINNVAVASLSLDENNVSNSEILSNDRYDYIIITSESLKPSFNQLAFWKTIKGIKTHVVSIEDIDSLFKGSDLVVKIKKYLQKAYYNGTRFAMLGGDVTIVPTRYCEISDGKRIETVPVDMYYGCMGGNFEWNANENDIYGEPDDGIDYCSNLFVTRLPVKNSEETISYCKRIIDYEFNSHQNRIQIPEKSSFLCCGSYLIYQGEANNRSREYDGSDYGETLYSRHFKDKWEGDVTRLYESNSHYYGELSIELKSTTLQECLRKGYSFVNMMSHGDYNGWKFCNNDKYSCENARTLVNSGFSNITTIACFSNEFDTEEKIEGECLSESFIRNGKSGVLTYLGATRTGIGNFSAIKDNSIDGYGPSYSHVAKYYDCLLQSKSKFNNFGELVGMAKYILSNNNFDITSRWVQFGLNPIGDSELPIVTSQIQMIDRPSIVWSEGLLTITVNEKDCHLCVSSPKNLSIYKRSEGYGTHLFNDINSTVLICFTKRNCIPRLYRLSLTGKIGNPSAWSVEELTDIPYSDSCSPNTIGGIQDISLENEMVKICYEVLDKTNNVNIILTDKYGMQVENMSCGSDNNSVCIQRPDSGLYVVSLLQNGEVIDSKKTIF